MAAFCEAVEAEDIAITPAIGQRALKAARAYGKFVGHEASLNFGDCFRLRVRIGLRCPAHI